MYIQLMTVRKKRTIRKHPVYLLLISFILLVITYTAKGIAASRPDLVENYFSRSLFPVTSGIQSAVSNLLPFSMYEIVIVVLILFILYRLILLIRAFSSKRAKDELVRFFTCIIFLVSAGLFLFHFLWSLNNYRIPMKEQLGLTVENTSVNQLADTYRALIERANALKADLPGKNSNISGKEAIRLVLNTAWEGYKPLAPEHSIFHSRRVRVKGLFFSRVQTVSGYAGVYSFLTGEPNINVEPPLVTLPHTACHEIAHQMGITFEDEANYAGFLACKNHPEILFQYSGYLSAVSYTGNALYGQSPELYNEISALISDDIRADRQEIRHFWDRYQKKTATEIADRVNEIYLLSNNQEEGLKSYGRFVDLLIADYLKDGEI